MASGFYFTSRSEEEKTKDIIMYETKARAGAVCKKYEKTKKRADLATLITAVAGALITFPFFYKAYDNESFVGMAVILVLYVLVTVTVRLCVGAVLSHSLKTFIKWGTLSAKWTVARKDMHDYEAKLAEQSVFENDIKKAEEKLMKASNDLIDFAKANNISIDE